MLMYLILNILVGPQRCGGGLESKYTVNPGKKLFVDIGFCGKPPPIVTCKFDGATYISVDVTEISQYNYTYTFVIPTNLKPCERTELSCTANSHGEAITDNASVIGKCKRFFKYMSLNFFFIYLFF